MFRTLVIHLVLVTMAAAYVTACKKADEDSDDDTGNPPTGTVDDAAGFYLRYKTSKNYTYNIHKGDTTFDTECKAVANEQVTCFLEADELDLAFHGYTLQYNVPSTLCSYVTFHPYYFFSLPIGVGPNTVQVDTDKNSVVCTDDDDDGTCEVGEAQPPVSTCDFDYTAVGGPNCCLGTYDRSDRTWDASANNGNGAYGPTTTTSNIPWGGDPSLCIAGPAVDTQPKDTRGFPTVDIFFVEGSGINKEYKVESPITRGLNSNVYVANFYIPGGHTGGIPAGMVSRSFLGKIYPVQPFFRVRCLDRAQELKSEILLQVREWNTVKDFDARKDFPALHSRTGNEDTPFGNFQLNDSRDWLDFEGLAPYAGYPGFSL